jgi:hypothetical protein
LVEEEQAVAHQLKKSSLVGVRFLPEEKEQLKELAAAQKKTLSELVRGIVLRQMERTHRKSVPEGQ